MKNISRFPKMMVLQYERAKSLGFNEEMAQAIGYAQALKYAIFKRSFFRGKIFSNSSPTQGKSHQVKVNKTFQLYFKNGYPFVGKKIVKDDDFRKEVYKKFGEKYIFEIVRKWAENIVKSCPKEILENEQKFFKLVWVPHRDENPFEMNLGDIK